MKGLYRKVAMRRLQGDFISLWGFFVFLKLLFSKAFMTHKPYNKVQKHPKSLFFLL